jgi:broad specificity phosphatase PhoE
MLQETFSPMDKITHIVCSPMRRTLQTALLGFQPLLDRGLKIVAYPDLREWGNSPSSSGYPLDLLETQYAGKPLDLSLVPEGWEINREDQWDKSRASIVREELWMLGNQALQTAGGSWKNCALPPREILTQNVEILVVSHGSFLATLVDANSKLLYFLK